MKSKILTAVIAAAMFTFVACSDESGSNATPEISDVPGVENPGDDIPGDENSGLPIDTGTIVVQNPTSSADVETPVVESSSSEIAQVPVSSSSVVNPPASSSSQVSPVSSSSEVVPVSSSNTIASSSSEVVSSSSEVVVPQLNKSVGCGKSLGSIQTGFYKISSNGKDREYAIDIPANYDPNKPYRLIYCSHWIWSSAKDVVNGQVGNGGAANWAFFGLKRVLDSAGVQAIFIAPSADGGMWGEADHALFDNLLSYAKTNLCVDTDRVFATGFSFGAMQTFSLSTNHQKDLRAVATLAAANYNIWLPTNTHEKIAYLGITGMSDGTCPFIQDKNRRTGGFYAAQDHAKDNGCEVPESIPTTNVGSKSHLVYDYKNCDPDYPVRYITFDGGHIAAPTDGQTSDDGRRTWAPHETWKFFSQF